jgi:hypothetical protein
MTEPSVWGVLRTGLPGFLREGFLPVAAFYVGLSLSGLAAGVVAATLASAALYAHERAAGREGLLVRLSLAFVAIQAILGLVSHSAVVYLATPVLANAAWGLVFVGSVAVARPLAGTLACAWYPFSREFRDSVEFRRVYGVESLVWGAYFIGRSALRLAVLLHGTIGSFVIVAFVTGPPVTLALITWSIWYAIRRFSDEAGDQPVVLARDET